MVAPSSAQLPEIFLQVIESEYIVNLLIKHNSLVYFPYVGDIRIIYDSIQSNINTYVVDFNQIRPNLDSTFDIETDNIISYLDLTI